MESKHELKEIDIKNRTCYYFDDINKDAGIYFSDILLDKKLCENISVYDISYKISTSPKPLRIRFDKIDAFIRGHGDEFRHSVLFDYELFDKFCDKIKYLLSQRSDDTESIKHNFGESELIHIILYLMKKY